MIIIITVKGHYTLSNRLTFFKSIQRKKPDFFSVAKITGIFFYFSHNNWPYHHYHSVRNIVCFCVCRCMCHHHYHLFLVHSSIIIPIGCLCLSFSLDVCVCLVFVILNERQFFKWSNSRRSWRKKLAFPHHHHHWFFPRRLSNEQFIIVLWVCVLVEFSSMFFFWLMNEWMNKFHR